MNLERFTDYYNKKMRFNLHINKRLKAIEEYFLNEHAEIVSFMTKDSCYAYIVTYTGQHEDNSEEILEQLYYTLEHSFSSQNPYYISELETTVHKDAFARNIRRLFSQNVEYDDFTYELRNEVQYDANDETIYCELDFEEKFIDYITGERRRKSLGTIKITFDLKNKKFITSEAPNDRSHKNILEYFEMQGYTIKPIYVLKRSLTIRNKNFTDFSPTTLLIINLLLHTLPSMGYRITLDSINFTNIDSHDIQRMTLNGTNLLSSNEVLQRIHNGDTVHTLKITLNIISNRDGTQVNYGATFKIDLKGRLAFIFGDSDDNEARNREICIDIQNSIMKLIYEATTVQTGVRLINENLPKPKSLNEILSTIKSDLSELVDNTDDKIALKKYFVDNYAIS
ncbi:hypothetical protein [Psychrobacillus sp. FJAT-21963]|uniref:hypothetical protein n=1 Tax=Psychrobacillus sp. FJAT-21963 TaxID=1712028 RepID=UPI0006F87F1D|nr:hypothetical protein [Psychrobacillus sp. FJAT-21963]KQL33356.1 hypothetical protein AN959_17510 [Psychrobacillus sp. FJAT-21963]